MAAAGRKPSNAAGSNVGTWFSAASGRDCTTGLDMTVTADFGSAGPCGDGEGGAEGTRAMADLCRSSVHPPEDAIMSAAMVRSFRAPRPRLRPCKEKSGNRSSRPACIDMVSHPFDPWSSRRREVLCYRYTTRARYPASPIRIVRHPCSFGPIAVPHRCAIRKPNKRRKCGWVSCVLIFAAADLCFYRDPNPITLPDSPAAGQKFT